MLECMLLQLINIDRPFGKFNLLKLLPSLLFLLLLDLIKALFQHLKQWFLAIFLDFLDLQLDHLKLLLLLLLLQLHLLEPLLDFLSPLQLKLLSALFLLFPHVCILFRLHLLQMNCPFRRNSLLDAPYFILLAESIQDGTTLFKLLSRLYEISRHHLVVSFIVLFEEWS